ncbi:MAG: hypothetical protein IID42_08730 [Planctomycetes bacterium]|nr:hypothetical protein [Planctomycetota bacterium]
MRKRTLLCLSRNANPQIGLSNGLAEATNLGLERIAWIEEQIATAARENLFGEPGGVVRHAKYVTFQVAGVAVPRESGGSFGYDRGLKSDKGPMSVEMSRTSGYPAPRASPSHGGQ